MTLELILNQRLSSCKDTIGFLLNLEKVPLSVLLLPLNFAVSLN